MNVYLDSSIILRKLLSEPHPIEGWGEWEKCYTSEIASIECARALDRLRLQGRMTDIEMAEKSQSLKEIFEITGIIPLTPSILGRASQSFPTTIGTLDALHLSSALLWHTHRKKSLIFLTHDVRQGLAAQALGFETKGFNLTEA